MEDASLLSSEKEVYGTKSMSSSTVTDCCYPDVPDFSATAIMGSSKGTDATAHVYANTAHVYANAPLSRKIWVLHLT